MPWDLEDPFTAPATEGPPSPSSVSQLNYKYQERMADLAAQAPVPRVGGSPAELVISSIRKSAERQLASIRTPDWDRAKCQAIVSEYARLVEKPAVAAYVNAVKEREVRDVRRIVTELLSQLNANQIRNERGRPQAQLARRNEYPFWLVLGRACKQFLTHFQPNTQAYAVNQLIWAHRDLLFQLEDSKLTEFAGARVDLRVKIMALSESGNTIFWDSGTIEEIVDHGNVPLPRSPHDLPELPRRFLPDDPNLQAAIIDVLTHFGTLFGYPDDENSVQLSYRRQAIYGNPGHRY